MKEQVTVENLAIGMFVAELDRPWLDTPFLIQGFVIESQEQIEDFQRCCKFVFVDRALSTGDQFVPEVKEKVVVQRVRNDPKPIIHTEKDREKSATGEGVMSSIAQIFKSAFAKNETQASAQNTGTRTAADRDPVVIIHNDTKTGKSKPSAQAVERERGISQDELGFLRNEKDPADSVRIYSDDKPGAESRGGMFQRMRSWFNPGSVEDNAPPPAVVIETVEPVYPDKTTFEEELPKAQEAHEAIATTVQEVIADLQNNKTIELDKVNESVNWMVESVVRNPDGLIWLARLKHVDAYTYDHGLNTSIYMIAFGRHLGLPQEQLQIMGTVGLMQDVGKIRLPASLLDKRGKYSPAEFKVLQSHVQHSIDIINESKGGSAQLTNVVVQHHERYDGSGYPYGLKAEEITMLGSMAGLVDTYTAMISSRPYSQPVSVQQALQQLYGMRDQAFKAQHIEEFIQCVGVFPVGSLVELNTGEVAVVVAQNRSRRLKPRIMLVLDQNRQDYARPIMLDLLYDPPTPAGEPYRIVRGLQAGVYEFNTEQHFAALTEIK